jgi:hypothetical protein
MCITGVAQRSCKSGYESQIEFQESKKPGPSVRTKFKREVLQCVEGSLSGCVQFFGGYFSPWARLLCAVGCHRIGDSYGYAAWCGHTLLHSRRSSYGDHSPNTHGYHAHCGCSRYDVIDHGRLLLLAALSSC